MNENATVSIEQIFCQAIEIDSAEQRETFLREYCGDDRELMRQVHKLIDAHFSAGQFLSSRADGAAIRHCAISETVGSTIDRYRLVKEIGEGGFGVVFLAEQLEPIRRKVALKIIKPGMDSHEIIARFQAERQALALMDHPNIAHVLDAGTTDTGRPYFVMELINGEPITTFCDQHQLSTRERLELFQSVCRAVEHAHQKGIIHRDIKPSNILVSFQDGQPVARVIDFGVSKALNQPISERTYFTQFGQLVGTPQYMSPEQADMNDGDVDTRSDIYSMGVLLYELLTGKPPFDAKTLRQGGFDQMRSIIRQSEPLKPSTQIESLDNASAVTVAGQRRVHPRTLCKLIAGDLDWIVMKALEKDRNRRYPTANSLSDDIQRHLESVPISAHPPNVVDRVRKMAKKHKAAAGSLIGIALAVLLGLVGTSWAAYFAWHQYTHVQTLYAELQKANATLRQQASQLERLDRIEDIEVAENLFVKAKQANVFADKEQLYNQAGALFDKHDHKVGHAACLRQLSNDYQRIWNYPKSIASLERALTIYESSPNSFIGDDRPGWNAHNLAKLFHELGNYARETEMLEKLMRYHSHTRGERHGDTFFGLVRFAVHLDEVGQSERATEYWAEIRQILGDPDDGDAAFDWPRYHIDLVRSEMHLSDMQYRSGEQDPSRILELAANHNLHRSFMLPTIARAHAIKGNAETALRLLRNACESEWKSSMNAGSEELRRAITTDRWHVRLLKQSGTTKELETELRKSIVRRDSKLPSHHPHRAFVRQQLAQVLADMNRHEEAKTLLIDANKILDAQELTPKARFVDLYQQMAFVHNALGDNEAAAQWQARIETTTEAKE
jgi:serine/threonine protein kinase